jgi:putative SOS response-associated peptidase YedK
MCGRYGLTRPELIDPEELGVPDLPPLEPRWNIAPSQAIAAVVRDRDAREVAMLRWGLVPSWADDPKIGSRMANARADGIADKPAFRGAFRKRRCLVLADVFYEWQAPPSGRGRKQPFAVRRRDGRPFALAGIWDVWRPKDDAGAAPLRSCAIVTTEPNAVMTPIHERMPVVLDPRDYDAWLDPATAADAAAALLRGAPDDLLEAWPISLRVNDPGNDDPSVLEPA